MGSRRLQTLMFGLVCLIAGWLAGQYEWSLAAVQAQQAQQTPNSFTRITGWDFPVRKPGETQVTASTRRVSVELIRDDARGNLIYVSDTGSVAVVPQK